MPHLKGLVSLNKNSNIWQQHLSLRRFLWSKREGLRWTRVARTFLVFTRDKVRRIVEDLRLFRTTAVSVQSYVLYVCTRILFLFLYSLRNFLMDTFWLWTNFTVNELTELLVSWTFFFLFVNKTFVLLWEECAAPFAVIEVNATDKVVIFFVLIYCMVIFIL